MCERLRHLQAFTREVGSGGDKPPPTWSGSYGFHSPSVHLALVWQCTPKVKNLESPAGDLVERIEVVIFAEPYLIEFKYHVLAGITYTILVSIRSLVHSKLSVL